MSMNNNFLSGIFLISNASFYIAACLICLQAVTTDLRRMFKVFPHQSCGAHSFPKLYLFYNESGHFLFQCIVLHSCMLNLSSSR